MTLTVEKLAFTFPDGWVVVKYDDTAFYRKQFSKMWQPITAVDLIAVDETQTAYFIEVKDYRIARDAGPSELPQKIAQKVFDTLAAQLPCKLNANEETEKELARRVCHCRALVTVLHIEQPTIPSGIFRPYDRANLLQKLRQLLSPVHSRPWVLQKTSMGAAGWNVT